MHIHFFYSYFPMILRYKKNRTYLTANPVHATKYKYN